MTTGAQVARAEQSTTCVGYLTNIKSGPVNGVRSIEAWGFSYLTNLVWVKPSIGLGVWTRNRHELLLLARRGSMPPPYPDLLPDSVITAARGRHSEKPACFYELIERAYPHASKLELFARTCRPGWTG